MSDLSQPPVRFCSSTEVADLSVIVVNYNTGALLARCIGSLRAACGGLAVQVVIVDNASRDGSAQTIGRDFADCQLLANAVNVGFGRANNQALPLCTAPYVLLLNPDAYVFPDTLKQSLQHMRAHPDCGVLGAKLVNEEGLGSFCGRSFPTPWQSFTLQTGLFKGFARPSDEHRAAWPEAGAGDCDWVVGCYYLVRREVIDAVGLFDPRYFLYLEEVDHCRAVKQAGWKVQCLTDARVIHMGGASAATEGELSAGRQISALQAESSLLYYRKHGGWWGVLSAAALELATFALLSMKSLLLRRNLGQAAAQWAQARLLCRLMLDTRAGSRPTR
jgi:N-acetylglucosaminyl-diphospho-decaprenol L-rhamnosyltransferase